MVRFITNAPDLILTAEKGFNLRGSMASEKLLDEGPFTGKHSCEDAFFFNNKTDNVPYFNSDKPSVINEGELIKKIADGN